MLARLTPARANRSGLLRSGALLVTLAVLAPAWTAHAGQTTTRKPKPVCKLVKDGKADATGTGTAVTGPNDPDLDILSADIATNTRTLTAVVRLSALDASDNNAPTGREYQVVFNVGTVTESVDAVLSPSGNSFAGGKGKGVIVAAKKEIHISVPLSALPTRIPAKAKLTAIGARTYRVVGSDQIALGNADKADSTSMYVAGSLSCVKVGA